MLAPYPKARGKAHDAAAERDMAAVVELVTAIRTIRGEMRIAPGVSLVTTVRPTPEHAELFGGERRLIEALARAELRFDPNARRPPSSALAVVGGTEAYVELAGVIDVALERQRLEKEIKKAGETITFLEGKLARPEFVEKAPEEVVERERGRLHTERALREKLTASLAWISDGDRG